MDHLKIIPILLIISANVINSIKQFDQPRLGRTLHLGDMYNAKTGAITAGLSLWDEDTIKNNKILQRIPSTRIEALVEKDFLDQANVFKLDATVQMDFLAGLISVSGSANYLKDEKTTNNKVRVTGFVDNVNRTETLPVGKMASLVKYNRFCSEFLDVTHVISSVTYGLKAVFNFEKEERDSSKQNVLAGKLKAAINSIPTFKIEGDVSGSVDEIEKRFTQNLKTTFYGDFTPTKTPSTFEDARKFMYHEMPKYLDEPVITRFSVQPLSFYCDSANKLLHEISKQRLEQLTKILKSFRDTKRRITTLLEHPVAMRFRGIKNPLVSLDIAVKKKEIEVQTQLKTLLPEIRGSGEGSKLQRLMLDYLSSPVKKEKVDAFLNRREREINSIYPWITEAQSRSNVIVDEEKYAKDNKCLITKRYSLSLDIHVLPNENIADAFLLSEELDNSYPWYDLDEAIGKAGKIFRQFLNLAEINKRKEDICFIIQLKEHTKGDLISMSILDGGNADEFRPPQTPKIKAINQKGIESYSGQTIQIEGNRGINIPSLKIEVEALDSFNDINLNQTLVFILTDVTTPNNVVSSIKIKPNKNEVTFENVKAGVYNLSFYSLSDVGGLESKTSKQQLSVNTGSNNQAPSDYIVTELGGICTGVERFPLLDKDECMKASTSLNKTFIREEEQANYPRGCYWMPRGVNVFWNIHKTGKIREDCAAICRKQG